MKKEPIIIIDGKNLLWRNCDAFSELTAYVDGSDIHTGGMYGFVSALIRVRARYNGRIMIAWEGENNFRFDLYPEYKKRDQRTGEGKPNQEELYYEVMQSEGMLNELLSFANVPQFYGIGCEADDVMGTLAYFLKGKDTRSIIYTGDSDLRQLVDPKYITVVSPGRGKDVVYSDSKSVVDKHGVTPKQIPLLKAISGDSSDNIPGLSGIGDKIAARLVRKYRTLGNILLAAETNKSDWPATDRVKAIVVGGRKEVELFLKLTTIKTDAKVKAVPRNKDEKEVIRLLKLYKFRSLSSAAELLEIMRLYK